MELTVVGRNGWDIVKFPVMSAALYPEVGVSEIGRASDRKSVVQGKSVDLGGRGILKTKSDSV